jgi:ribosome-binding protein aMBF1 (putative translation factor)
MKSDEIYWNDILDRYRVSKTIRQLRHKMGLLAIAKKTNTTKQYVYAIQEMTMKPNQEFKTKLEKLHDN